MWPCLNVATRRRERSDRAIQQICNNFFTFGTQLSVFCKFIKVIFWDSIDAFCIWDSICIGTQFVLGLNRCLTLVFIYGHDNNEKNHQFKVEICKSTNIRKLNTAYLSAVLLGRWPQNLNGRTLLLQKLEHNFKCKK